MSVRNLLHRLEKAIDRGSEHECRCPHAPGSQSGGVLIGRAICPRCGGAFTLSVILEVVPSGEYALEVPS